MKQTVKSSIPMWKSDLSRKLAVGDTLTLVLVDKSTKAVTVTEVSEDKKTASWSITADGIPREADVLGVSSAHQKALADPDDIHAEFGDPDLVSAPTSAGFSD